MDHVCHLDFNLVDFEWTLGVLGNKQSQQDLDRDDLTLIP